jgi:ubiquinone/menaquinone biosynthesis C-methylase UbiE
LPPIDNFALPPTSCLDLPATGERFLPAQMSGDIELEHLHRYALALELAKGRTVLDIASGEGYGSNLLSQVATAVVGVDISPDAIVYARSRYPRGNLEFRQGSCAAIPVADHSIDLVVSFETLEHHDQHDVMLAEIKRVLKPDGLLIISTPNKLEYTDLSGAVNPYHVKELYLEEFSSLLARHFLHHTMLSQRIYHASLIAPTVNAPLNVISCTGDTQAIIHKPGLHQPIYYVALASDREQHFSTLSVLDGTTKFMKAYHLNLAELARLHDRLAHTERHLENVTRSIYWKITLPLRVVRKLMRNTLGV